jgi:hypothetical protein
VVVRLLALGVGVLVAAALGFFATLTVLDRTSGNGPVDTALEATRCEVELGSERCPGHPTFEPATKSRMFNDNWDNASTDIERCMKRAADFHGFCKSTSPVTARYFKGRQLVRVETKK